MERKWIRNATIIRLSGRQGTFVSWWWCSKMSVFLFFVVIKNFRKCSNLVSLEIKKAEWNLNMFFFELTCRFVCKKCEAWKACANKLSRRHCTLVSWWWFSKMSVFSFFLLLLNFLKIGMMFYFLILENEEFQKIGYKKTQSWKNFERGSRKIELNFLFCVIVLERST